MQILDKSVCPHCFSKLLKQPARKTKCPHCSQFMYVRTLQQTRVRVLTTETEAATIDAEWDVYNKERTAQSERDYFMTFVSEEAFTRDQLEMERLFGFVPSDNDVFWKLFNKNLLEYAKTGQWGLYRNIRMAMAMMLEKEQRYADSLMTYLEVLYRDQSDKCGSFIAPAILRSILEMAEKLEKTDGALWSDFCTAADRSKVFTDDISAEDAWKNILLYRAEHSEKFSQA